MGRANSSFFIEALELRQLLAAATVNFNDVRQTIDGFGASSAWMWSSLSTSTITNAFSLTSGAGLSLIRSRIAPPGWTSEANIALQALNNGARTWSTPWSPPREWKTNNDNNNGGALDPAHYQDYANLLANYVEDMNAQGVPLYAVSLQNEPNWVADYESCIWSAQQFANFLPFVGQTFASRGITAKIMLPESLNWNFSLADIVMTTPSLAQYVGILAAHNYGESLNSYQPYANANGKPVWETEVTLHPTSTVIANALDLADDIHQALTDGNASAYHYWWLSSSADGGLFDASWNPNKRLWAMGQYSRFVRPGWVRVGQTDDGGLDITTFKDPASGKFAIVVANLSTTNSINETFTLNGITASSVTPYITSATDNLVQYSNIAVTGGTTFTSTIAASSIVTFYGISNSAPTVQPPTNLTAAAVQGSTTSQIVLTWADNSSEENGYTVERSTDGTNFTVISSSIAANTTKYTDTGRTENTKYYYRVKANSAGGGSGYSQVVSASTVLAVTSNISGTRTASGINLNWTINSGNSTGIHIDRSLDGVLWNRIATLSSRATSYVDTISGYSANQVYYYRIRNSTASNYSGWTRWNTSIATPTGFSATDVTSTAVTFNWNAITTGISGAWIERYNSSTNTWSTVSPSALEASVGTWRLGGLASNTSYSFRMRFSGAADSIYSGYSSSINVVTPAASVTPVVWYKADETSGNTLTDSSGNGKNASLSGTYNFSTGVQSNALNLSGGHATLPTGIASELGDFTISMWIRPTFVDTWSRIFDFGTGTGNFMFLTPRSSTGFPRFSIVTTGGSQQQVDSNITISPSVWTHVAVTLSGNTATMYLNGVAVGTNSNVTYRPSQLGLTTQNYLGRSQFSQDPVFRGSLDEVRIYERALSLPEVQSLASTTAPTVASPASATPSPVLGKTAALSVLGADNNSEANLIYTWAATTLPSGAASPLFSTNGSNAAKSTTATFSKAGTYTFTVTITDTQGFTANSAVTVTVNQVSTSVGISPYSSVVNPGNSLQLTAGALDQFGDAMSSGLVFTFTQLSGVGTTSSSGLYTAPGNQGGLALIEATSGGITARAMISVPMDNTDASGVVFTGGTWVNSTTVGGYFGSNYQYFNITGGSGTATYSTAIPATGQYAIYARWAAAANRNSAVPYEITSASGISTVVVNQQNNGGNWNLIGTYNFNQGATGSVKIRTPADVDPNHSVIADGVMLQMIHLAPSVATSAFSTPPVVTGQNAILSVLGSDDGGESNLTYTWSLIGSPPAPVTYSRNANNAAQVTTVTFTQPGNYNFQVTITDAGGLSVTSTVSVQVNASPVSIDGTVGNDHFRVRANGSNIEFYDNGFLTQIFSRAMVSTFTLNGSDGNDTFVLDYSGGNPVAAGQIIVNGGADVDILQVSGTGLADSFQFNTAMSFAHNSSTANFNSIESLDISNGDFFVSANLGSINLLADGVSTQATLLRDQNLASLYISGGASVVSASTNASAPAMNIGAVTIDSSMLSISPNGQLAGVSQFNSLSLIGNGRLELHDNDLVLRYAAGNSPFAQLRNNVIDGLALLGGPGTRGIISSEVDSQSASGTMLGIVDNGAIGGAITATSGFNLSDPQNSVIIKFTWFGDSTLDGVVDGSDFALIDTGFSDDSLDGWVFGDYNFDQTVDNSDYALIDTGFLSQTTIL